MKWYIRGVNTYEKDEGVNTYEKDELTLEKKVIFRPTLLGGRIWVMYILLPKLVVEINYYFGSL